ncbi:hypothetical protein LZ023_39495 (plasmid) [Pseudomonas silvicola]|nr:hypothetical protein LZ023_39495 [Pseudomonas silvicola]
MDYCILLRRVLQTQQRTSRYRKIIHRLRVELLGARHGRAQFVTLTVFEQHSGKTILVAECNLAVAN